MKVKKMVCFYKTKEWIYAYDAAAHIIVRFYEGKAETIVKIPKELYSIIFGQIYVKNNYIFLYSMKDVALYIYNMDEARECVKILDKSDKELTSVYSELIINDNMLLLLPHKDAKPLAFDFNGNELNFNWLKTFGKTISEIFKTKEASLIRIMGNVIENGKIGCICTGGLYDKILFFDIENCSYKLIELEGYKNFYQLSYRKGSFFVQGEKQNSLYLVGFDIDGNILAEHFISNNASLHLQWWNDDSLVIFEDEAVYKVHEPWKIKEEKVKKIEFNQMLYFYGPGFLVNEEGDLYESDGEVKAPDYEIYLLKDKDFCRYKYEKTDDNNGFFAEIDSRDLESFICSLL